MPIGPTTAKRLVPTWQFCCISRVVLPTAWITSVIVPSSGSKSASVSGMRSPCSCSITMTNWPALRGLRHHRVADLQQVGDVGVILAGDNLEIGHACVLAVRAVRATPGARKSSLRARAPLATDATPAPRGGKGCRTRNLDLGQPVRCARRTRTARPARSHGRRHTRLIPIRQDLRCPLPTARRSASRVQPRRRLRLQDRARAAAADPRQGRPVACCPKALLVGIETSDDAAVYQLNERQAIVATTDFFMPIVDDPHDFGAIAATNAISDVYAMGGTPLFALALVGMPIDKLPVETIRRILEGGEAVCATRRHPDRRRPHDRLGGADLRARRRSASSTRRT